MASRELGRRTLQNKRSKSYTKKSREQKISEEMARLFLDQIYLEKEVEKLKCELSHRIDFTCRSAFNVFNFRGLEALTHAEFSEALFSFIGNSYYNREQSYLMFNRYDKDVDGRINYRDFCRMIVPSDRVLSSLLCGRSSEP